MRFLLPWDEIESRFTAKVNRGQVDECWTWSAYRDPRGYGRLNLPTGAGKRPILAHRLAWMLHHRRVIESSDTKVLHRCDNPPCVNPAHLFLGTDADNVTDMIEKGRQDFSGLDLGRAAPRRYLTGDAHRRCRPPERRARGESHGVARLTEDDVRSVRRERRNGASLNELAEQHDVSPSMISRICLGHNWTHVEETR